MRATAPLVVLVLVLAVVTASNSRQVTAQTGLSQTLSFPSVGDDWNLSNDGYWSVPGESVSGMRPIDITDIRAAQIHLELEYNEASNTNPHEFEVRLNGEWVGTFTVTKNDGDKKDASIGPFGPIETNGLVEIEYRLLACGAWSGVIIKADDSSEITLSDGLPPETKKDFTLRALGKLEKLYDGVDQADIDQGRRRSLLSKLDSAIVKLDKALDYINEGDEEKANSKLRTAKNSVLSFVKAVDAFSERIAPYSEAWREDAGTIMMLIETAIEIPI